MICWTILSMSKNNNPLYILNPQTQRYVLKTGSIGKSILNETKKNHKNQIVPLFPKPLNIPKRSILILNPLGQWQVLPLEHFVV